MSWSDIYNGSLFFCDNETSEWIDYISKDVSPLVNITT